MKLYPIPRDSTGEGSRELMAPAIFRGEYFPRGAVLPYRRAPPDCAVPEAAAPLCPRFEQAVTNADERSLEV